MRVFDWFKARVGNDGELVLFDSKNKIFFLDKTETMSLVEGKLYLGLIVTEKDKFGYVRISLGGKEICDALELIGGNSTDKLPLGFKLKLYEDGVKYKSVISKALKDIKLEIAARIKPDTTLDLYAKSIEKNNVVAKHNGYLKEKDPSAIQCVHRLSILWYEDKSSFVKNINK